MRQLNQRVDGAGLDLQPAAAEAALGIGAGPLDDRPQVVGAERLQHQHRGARQQRRDDLERRVLGGGPDQDDRAVLDVRQEGILLGLVEAVDLVDEQDRAAPVLLADAPRLLDDHAQFLDARQHRREGDEVRIGAARDQPRQRRLARSGRPPEDERVQALALDHVAQQPLIADQVRLPDELRQRGRPHPLGQRRVGGRPRRHRGRAEQRRLGVRRARHAPA